MQITARATRLCPMCNEINQVKVGQVEFVCVRCGYTESTVVKPKPKVSKFKDSKPPKGLGRKSF